MLHYHPPGSQFAPGLLTVSVAVFVCFIMHVHCMQVLQDTSCGEVWKLHLVELLLEGRLLDPQQAVQLLSVFDR